MTQPETPDAEESKKAYMKFLEDRARITEAAMNTRSVVVDAEHSAKNLQASADIMKLVRQAIKKISDTLDGVLESRKNKGQTP